MKSLSMTFIYSFFLTVLAQPEVKIEINQSQKYLIFGSSYADFLNCYAYNKPENVVLYRINFDGSLITISSQEDTRYKFVCNHDVEPVFCVFGVTQVKSSDAGTYLFKASYASGGIGTSRVYVPVYNAELISKISGYPPYGIVEANRSFSLTCQTEVPGGEAKQFIMKWMQNGTKTVRSQAFLSDFTYTVQRANPISDPGYYTCIVYNTTIIDTMNCPVTIDVHYAAKVTEFSVSPPNFVDKLKNVVVNEGERVQLFCVVIGNPSPNVEIGRFKKTKLLRKNKTSKKIFYNISKAVPEDSGVYQCKTSNSLGDSYAEISLYVKEKKKH